MMTPDNIVDKEHLTMDSEVLGRSEEKWFALALGCDGNADCGEKYESLSFKEGMKRETFPIGGEGLVSAMTAGRASRRRLRYSLLAILILTGLEAAE
eukprot:scaffold1771_cov211-Alexandrium_tamarense.AAC.17